MYLRVPLRLLFLAVSYVLHAKSLDINCTAEGLKDTACGYYIIKTINTYINQDEMYSRGLSPVMSALDLPVIVNVSMGLNHIPDIDMLAGTVQVSAKILNTN